MTSINIGPVEARKEKLQENTVISMKLDITSNTRFASMFLSSLDSLKISKDSSQHFKGKAISFGVVQIVFCFGGGFFFFGSRILGIKLRDLPIVSKKSTYNSGVLCLFLMTNTLWKIFGALHIFIQMLPKNSV